MPTKKRILLSVVFICLFIAGCRSDDEGNSSAESVKTKSGIEMVRIPAGWLEMGSKNGHPDEAPVHKVWIDSFLMDKFEVTQKRFRQLKISDPSHFKDPNNPVEQVNWHTAIIFCNERSKAEGLQPCYNEQTLECDFDATGYRLPTEAEWEYACRANTKTEYFFGNNGRLLKDYAFFSENSSNKTHPAGGKKANRWGLFDMLGNVAEWCSDFYSRDYYKNSPDKNPKGPPDGKEKVVRGGAWNSSGTSCRSAYRSSCISLDDTCLADDAIGFRCVRKISDADLKEPAMQNENQKAETVTGFVYDDMFLRHKTGIDHPERPERLTAIVQQLKQDNLYSKLAKIEATPAPTKWITEVHTREYVERVRESCQKNLAYLDMMDTTISQESYDTALLAAGGVLNAVDAVMNGRVKNAFCAVRPPGHHAMPDKAMGFCIFNNVAIAAKYLQKQYNLTRILIVDWDVHHGNGTQSVFYDDPNVLYFSVHQSPFYPYTGESGERGAGWARNFTINVPLPAGSADSDYKKAFEEKLLPAALSFEPEFILISAGFDAQQGDTIGKMELTPQGFAELTGIVKRIADRCCQGRIVSVLEGGYNIENLPKAVEAHIKVLMEPGQ